MRSLAIFYLSTSVLHSQRLKTVPSSRPAKDHHDVLLFCQADEFTATSPCSSTPPAVSNGVVSACAGKASGVRCAPTCNSGYTASGSYLCTNGAWSGTASCNRESNFCKGYAIYVCKGRGYAIYVCKGHALSVCKSHAIYVLMSCSESVQYSPHSSSKRRDLELCQHGQRINVYSFVQRWLFQLGQLSL